MVASISKLIAGWSSLPISLIGKIIILKMSKMNSHQTFILLSEHPPAASFRLFPQNEKNVHCIYME